MPETPFIVNTLKLLIKVITSLLPGLIVMLELINLEKLNSGNSGKPH